MNQVEPYKDIEFDEFIKEIGAVGIKNWSLMAECLGVHRETILRWKKHTLARQAIVHAIQENIEGMTMAGRGDWKMYREKLKMLGLKDNDEIETLGSKDIESIVNKIDNDNQYKQLAEEASEQLRMETVDLP